MYFLVFALVHMQHSSHEENLQSMDKGPIYAFNIISLTMSPAESAEDGVAKFISLVRARD